MLCRQKPKRKKRSLRCRSPRTPLVPDFEPGLLFRFPTLPDEMPNAEPKPLIIPMDPDIEPDTRIPEAMKTAA